MPRFTTDTIVTSKNDPISVVLIARPYKACNLLEIGVYEGCYACWLLDNVLTHPESKYLGVDSWMCDNPNAEDLAEENLKPYGNKARLMKGESKRALQLITQQFDVINVDGDHSFNGCFSDLINSWVLLKPDGLLVCDDVMRNDYGVATAIHSFLAITPATSYRILYWGYRALIEKLKN